jgi:hypothetical protein
MRQHLRNTALVLCCWLPTSLGAAEPGPSAAGDAKVTEPAATPPWWIAAELHVSLLSNLVEKSTVNLAFGFAAKAGYRWRSDWGAYFLVEHDAWVETEIATDVKQGVLNLGFGAERLFFQRRMRTALSIGPSILLYDTALDDAGTTGLYADIRPTGIRWPVGKGFTLVLDPLTFTIEAPALGGIPLVQIQYRTLFGVEYGLGR